MNKQKLFLVNPEYEESLKNESLSLYVLFNLIKDEHNFKNFIEFS